jgi:protein-L-isoaspartate(D-aspartate) O-methyltransferase
MQDEEKTENIQNKKMINYLLFNKYITIEIAVAMEKIEREFFVPSEFASSAYLDLPLPIGYGQTISAPSMVGIMLKELMVKKGMKVLEIGTGSGWQTALLAFLVGENGKVYSVEKIQDLASKAEERIKNLGIKNMEIKIGDGTLGMKENAPFDRIIVSASAPEIPKPLIEQLANEGKMLIPMGSGYWQELILVEKDKNGKISTRQILPVMFVPLVGKFAYPENNRE